MALKGFLRKLKRVNIIMDDPLAKASLRHARNLGIGRSALIRRLLKDDIRKAEKKR